MLMFFVTFNDAHFSDTPPESRVDEDYNGTLLAKLDQVAKVAVKIEAKAVLNAGDLFHLKNASRNSHSLVQRLTRKFNEMPPVISIAGNHDITHDRLDSLPRQPLGDLFEAGITRHIHLEEVYFQLPSSDPTKLQRKVAVCGLSFVPKLEDFAGHEVFRDESKDGVTKIGLFHCSAIPAGGDLRGEKLYSYEEMAEMFPGVDVFVLGHLHFYTGIHTVAGATFMNLGALSRCSLHLDNLERKVYAGLIEINPEGAAICKQVALRVLPADQVLSVEKHNRQKEERRQIEEFIDSLREETTTTSSGDAIRDYLNRKEVPDLVREKALSLLEEAGLNA